MIGSNLIDKNKWLKVLTNYKALNYTAPMTKTDLTKLF